MTPGACPCCQLWVAQDGDEKPVQAVAVERAALVESQPHSCADCQRRARFIRRVVGAHERVVRVFGRFVKPEALLCDSGLIRVAGLRAADQVRLSCWEMEALLLRRWAEGGEKPLDLVQDLREFRGCGGRLRGAVSDGVFATCYGGPGQGAVLDRVAVCSIDTGLSNAAAGVVTTPDQATTMQPFRLTTRHICADSGQDKRQRDGVAAAEWGPWQEAKSAAAVWRAAQRSATIDALDPELAAQLPNGLFPIAGATAAPPRVAVGPQEQPAVAPPTDPRMDGAMLRGGTMLHVPAADAQGSNEGTDDAEDERWVGEPEVAPNVRDVAAAIFAEAKKRGETELGAVACVPQVHCLHQGSVPGQPTHFCRWR